jgi:hypothetical protein
MDKKLLHRYSTNRTEARSLTHERSSVGARSSSAAPSDRTTVPTHERSLSEPFHLSGRGGFVRGGGRGRPRSDRRAFVY